MSDCFNAITLAVWVYVLIPFWMVWGYYWIKDKRANAPDVSASMS